MDHLDQIFGEIKKIVNNEINEKIAEKDHKMRQLEHALREKTTGMIQHLPLLKEYDSQLAKFRDENTRLKTEIGQLRARLLCKTTASKAIQTIDDTSIPTKISVDDLSDEVDAELTDHLGKSYALVSHGDVEYLFDLDSDDNLIDCVGFRKAGEFILYE